MATKNTLTTRITLEEVQNVQSALEMLGRAGQKAFADIKASAAQVPMATTKVTSGFNKVRSAGIYLRNSLLSLRSAVGGIIHAASNAFPVLGQFAGAMVNSRTAALGLAAAGTAAGAGILAMTKSAADNADRLSDHSESLGLSTTELQNFETMATKAGLSTDQLGSFLQKFAVRSGGIQDAMNDLSRATEILTVKSEAGGTAQVKIVRGAQNIKQASDDAAKATNDLAAQFEKAIAAGKTFDERLQLAAKFFDQFTEGPPRLAAIAEVFGERASAAYARMFSEIRKGEESLKGVVPPLSEQDVADLKAFSEAWDNLSLSVDRYKDRVSADAAPFFTQELTDLNDLVIAIDSNDWDAVFAKIDQSHQRSMDRIGKASQVAVDFVDAQMKKIGIDAPALREQARQLFTDLGALARWARDEITNYLSGITIEGAATSLKNSWDAIWAYVVKAGTNAMEAVSEAVRSTVQTIANHIKAAIAAMRELLSLQRETGSTGQGNSGGGGGGGAGGGFASGGIVRGPGSGTSDSILARLSNGEFVVRAAAVRALGLPIMHALNNLSMPQAFSLGGLVDGMNSALMPRLVSGVLAGPAPAGGGRPMYFDFGTERFGPLTASDDVAGRLATFLMQRLTRKA